MEIWSGVLSIDFVDIVANGIDGVIKSPEWWSHVF